MLRVLSKDEKEEFQRRGYMCEHLLCLYSMVADQTFLYNDDFPVFVSSFGEADIVLFGLGKEEGDKFECVKELVKLPVNTLNIISPIAFRELPNVRTKYVDWDFHIHVDRFDFDLKDSKYKDVRYRLKQVEKIGYQMQLSREFTPKHTYILSRHMARHKFDAWGCEELLSLERFFREHDHGLMMEAYKDDRLVGFDVVDFFEDNNIMAVPLGIYLDVPLISYFLMYENLKFARDKGYEWLDVGLSCEVTGLRQFKEKWLAKPKYKIYVQTLNIDQRNKTDLKKPKTTEMENS